MDEDTNEVVFRQLSLVVDRIYPRLSESDFLARHVQHFRLPSFPGSINQNVTTRVVLGDGSAVGSVMTKARLPTLMPLRVSARKSDSGSDESQLLEDTNGVSRQGRWKRRSTDGVGTAAVKQRSEKITLRGATAVTSLLGKHLEVKSRDGWRVARRITSPVALSHRIAEGCIFAVGDADGAPLPTAGHPRVQQTRLRNEDTRGTDRILDALRCNGNGDAITASLIPECFSSTARTAHFIGFKCGAVLLVNPTDYCLWLRHQEARRARVSGNVDLSSDESVECHRLLELLATSTDRRRTVMLPQSHTRHKGSSLRGGIPSTQTGLLDNNTSLAAGVQLLGYHRGAVTSLAFDVANNVVLSGGADGELVLWNASGIPTSAAATAVDSSIVSQERFADAMRSRSLIQRFLAHEGTITAIGVYHDVVVTGSVDKTVKIWTANAQESDISPRGRDTSGKGDFTWAGLPHQHGASAASIAVAGRDPGRGVAAPPGSRSKQLVLKQVLCFSSWVSHLWCSPRVEQQGYNVIVGDAHGNITVLRGIVSATKSSKTSRGAVHDGHSTLTERVTSLKVERVHASPSLSESDGGHISGPSGVIKVFPVEQLNALVVLNFDSMITLFDTVNHTVLYQIQHPATAAMAPSTSHSGAAWKKGQSSSFGETSLTSPLTRFVDVIYLPRTNRLVMLDSNALILLWDVDASGFICVCSPSPQRKPRRLICADPLHEVGVSRALLSAGNHGSKSSSSYTGSVGSNAKEYDRAVDGFWLATEDAVGHIRIEADATVPRLRGHMDRIVSINPGPTLAASRCDGSEISDGADDHDVRVCESGLTKAAQQIYDRISAASGVAFASASSDNRICLWNSKLDLISVHHSPEVPEIVSCLYVADWGTLITGHSNGQIIYWATTTIMGAKAPHKLHGNSVSAMVVASLPQTVHLDSPLLATVSFDGYLGMWLYPNHHKAQPFAKVRVSYSELVCVAFSDVSSTLIVGDNTGVVSTWFVGNAITPHRIMCTPHPSGSERRVRAPRSIQRESQVVSDKHLYVLTAHSEAVSAITVDGNFVFTGAEDGTVRLWDVRTGALLQSYVLHPSGPHAVARETGIPLEPILLDFNESTEMLSSKLSWVQNESLRSHTVAAYDDEVQCMLVDCETGNLFVGTRGCRIFQFVQHEVAPIRVYTHHTEVTALCMHKGCVDPSSQSNAEVDRGLSCPPPKRTRKYFSSPHFDRSAESNAGEVRALVVGGTDGTVSKIPLSMFRRPQATEG